MPFLHVALPLVARVVLRPRCRVLALNSKSLPFIRYIEVNPRLHSRAVIRCDTTLPRAQSAQRTGRSANLSATGGHILL